MGQFEISSRKPSTFEVAVTRVVSQTLAFLLNTSRQRTFGSLNLWARGLRT
jgi:hypothetical protein